MKRLALSLAASAALCSAATARSLTYELPQDATPAVLSQPEAELVVSSCGGCHSLDYLTTQPPGKGAQFWRDAVNKMITVYGAPVQPGEVDDLTTVLAGRMG